MHDVYTSQGSQYRGLAVSSYLVMGLGNGLLAVGITGFMPGL